VIVKVVIECLADTLSTDSLLWKGSPRSSMHNTPVEGEAPRPVQKQRIVPSSERYSRISVGITYSDVNLESGTDRSMKHASNLEKFCRNLPDMCSKRRSHRDIEVF
jgi:hypothetical protein